MLNFIAYLVTAVATLTASMSAPVDHHYANQTPYGDAATSTVKAPPKGYELTFVETVGRHGARTMTSSSRERRSLKVWEAAREQGALTDVGERFERDVRAFQQPEQQIGYGNLSSVGEVELRGIGRRTAEQYGAFLRQATRDGDQVVFKTSPVLRTEQSAQAMQQTLEAGVPGLKVADYVTDPFTLLIGNGASIDGNHAVEEVHTSRAVVAAAKGLLDTLYERSYVDSLDDPVLAALDIYLLYCIAPGMAGDTDVTFADYVPAEDAAVLEHAVDAENFYQYGPGVAGQDNSFQAARPLLKDFFTELDERLAGGDTAAVFRLAHGETTMPFAALTDLPGSQVQVPKGQVYTADNPWRGVVAGRLAGNVEWAAYRDAAGRALVTVRHNEQPVKLSARCTPTAPYFYRPAELKRCLD